MKKIRVGGVPEHFNLPWHQGVERGLFKNVGIDLDWITYKGGTGAMTSALRNDEVDLCILLTEGIVTDIGRGNPSKVISAFVESPLIWGIHSGITNPISSHDEIYDKKFAISRFGSGSHLMPIVDAYFSDLSIKQSQFQVINNLDGALTSLDKNETDVFYWEKFTTKPYVDQGILKRIGEYPTPWPCFVIAATEKILEKNGDAISEILKVIHRLNKEFMQSSDSISSVSERYELKKKDVEEWFKMTKWATQSKINEQEIDQVITVLKKAEILDKNLNLSSQDILFML